MYIRTGQDVRVRVSVRVLSAARSAIKTSAVDTMSRYPFQAEAAEKL
jgi:hypothetical protein